MDRVTPRNIVVFLFWLIGVVLIGVLMVFQGALIVFPIIAILLVLRGWQQQRQGRLQGAHFPWYRQPEIILALGLIVGVAVTYWMQMLPEQNYDAQHHYAISRYVVLFVFLVVYGGLLLRALFTVLQGSEVVMTGGLWLQRSPVRLFRKEVVKKLLQFFGVTSMVFGVALIVLELFLIGVGVGVISIQVVVVSVSLLVTIATGASILLYTFTVLDREKN